MSKWQTDLWEVFVTVTAVAAWIGVLCWMLRARQTKADDDDMDEPVEDQEMCIFCGDPCDGHYGRNHPMALCAFHGVRHRQLDESYRIEE